MAQQSALLILDMQVSILNTYLTDGTPVINGVAKAISIARQNNIPVIYVVSGFRKHAPELSANNKFYSSNSAYYKNSNPEELLKIHPAAQPENDDIIIN